MVKIQDFEDFVKWCKENEYNPAERASRKAYEAAHKPGATGRKNSARDAVLIAIGTLPDGTKLFRKATCSYRDRNAAADVLRWEMTSGENPCDSVSFIVGEPLEDSQ